MLIWYLKKESTLRCVWNTRSSWILFAEFRFVSFEILLEQVCSSGTRYVSNMTLFTCIRQTRLHVAIPNEPITIRPAWNSYSFLFFIKTHIIYLACNLMLWWRSDHGLYCNTPIRAYAFHCDNKKQSNCKQRDNHRTVTECVCCRLWVVGVSVVFVRVMP